MTCQVLHLKQFHLCEIQLLLYTTKNANSHMVRGASKQVHLINCKKGQELEKSLI